MPTDLPFPMTYNVDVQTTDVSNLSVATHRSSPRWQPTRIIGLDSDFVGPAASPMPIKRDRARYEGHRRLGTSPFISNFSR